MAIHCVTVLFLLLIQMQILLGFGPGQSFRTTKLCWLHRRWNFRSSKFREKKIGECGDFKPQ